MGGKASKILAVSLVSFICGCGRSDPMDVFTSPAVKAAMRAAKNVAPGRMESTMFTAYNTGHMIQIEGSSYILKLPRNASGNARKWTGYQWYVGGHSCGPISYSPPAYKDWFVEDTRCWLVDIAVQRNYFSDNPDMRALAWIRLKALGGTRGLSRHGPIRLDLPESYDYHHGDPFVLWRASDRDIQTGVDIPIGVWCAWDQSRMERESPRPLEVMDLARVCRAACVFFVRFQEHHPAEAD